MPAQYNFFYKSAVLTRDPKIKEREKNKKKTTTYS